MKPRIFIGSSVEGLVLAQTIQVEMEYLAYAELWNQNTFVLTSNALDDLLRKLNEVDYAVFVFSPDDALTIRQQQLSSARDNVIFEFGLFLGRLGKNRLFFVTPRDRPDFHIPTDLLGVKPATYDATRIRLDKSGKIHPAVTVGELRPVLATALAEIQNAIRGNQVTETLFSKLSRRLVYLLRYMQRDAQYRVATHYWKVLAIYKEDGENKTKNEWLPEEKAGWMKASEFACFYLSALGLVDRAMPSPGFRISKFGEGLLASKDAQEAFRIVFEKPLIE